MISALDKKPLDNGFFSSRTITPGTETSPSTRIDYKNKGLWITDYYNKGERSQLHVGWDVSRQVSTTVTQRLLLTMGSPMKICWKRDFNGAAIPNFIAAQGDLNELRDQPRGRTIAIERGKGGSRDSLEVLKKQKEH